jgi:Zn finger protein HypA/HybF involved in hydrogenase expression
MVEGTGIEIEDEIGVCTECNEGTAELRPHPDDVSADGHQGDLEDARMICPDCHDSILSD